MSNALVQAWAATVRRHGPQRAIVQASDGRSATFSELDALSSAWRETHLRDLKKSTARAVVFATPNGIGWFEIFLGLLKAGAVIVPVDAGEPLVAQRRMAVALRAALWWDGAKLHALDHPRRFRSSKACLIKLTSGTTGKPRSLVFATQQLLADSRQVTSSMGIGPRDLNYALIPLGHSYGLGNLTLPLLAQGIPLVCGSAPLPHAIAADFAAWQPSVFPGVPAMWRALSGSEVVLPSLRLGISAGAPLPPEIARAFANRFGQRLHSFYGSSETGGIAYDRSGAAAFSGEVGGAMRGVKLTALSNARLRVKSPAVFTHRNRHRSGAQGMWIMPDRVAVNSRGGVKLLGRRGTTVKISGRRVNLAEVSDRLRGLAGVREVWVGISPGTDPILGAAVVTDRSAAEIRAALLLDTASWKIPKKLVVAGSLPVTARGKPDARALSTLVF